MSSCVCVCVCVCVCGVRLCLEAVTWTAICSTAKFDALVAFLESQKLVGVWEGEFGILGTKSGRDSFLPRKRMPADLLSSLPTAQASGATDLELDNGDFCGFLSRSAPSSEAVSRRAFWEQGWPCHLLGA